MPRRKFSGLDLTGRQFGSLSAIKEQRIPGTHNVHWLCRCKCGTEKLVDRSNLINGSTASCGCERNQRRIEKVSTHGKSRTPEYIVWYGMISRCHKPHLSSYADYGAKGIVVCQEWRDSFEKFLEDMGKRPSPKHTLDRRKNFLGYNKENCRWATPEEQSRNRTDNKFIEIDGLSLCQADWCRKLGLEYSNAYRTAKKRFDGSLEKFIRHRYREALAIGAGDRDDHPPAA